MRKRMTVFILTVAIMVASLLPSSAISEHKLIKNGEDIKNVIFLIADGMSVDGVTLTRWYNSYDAKTGKVDTSVSLNMDSMASGLVRTYWKNATTIGAITDSAPAGTALATGVKTNDKFLGVTPEKTPVANLTDVAKLLGKSTGLVATSTIMHATPAAFSSHYPDRSKEMIIAEQQVYQNIDVMFGAGSARLASRTDNENLISVLKRNGYNYITEAMELEGLSTKTWGMFAPTAMSYEMDRATNTPTEPSLTEMTKSAISILSENENGFFLMVEGSKIDWAAHANDPIGLISDINAFDHAVGAALEFAKADGHTMVIVTTDHGNGGITIGDKNTSSSYSSDPVSRFIAPLKNATLTGEGIEKKLDAEKTNIVEVMKTYYGISDLTEDEIAAIKATKSGSMNYTVGPMISKRANIGWTTGGHTGEDVVLYTYLPGDERLTGTIENTSLATITASIWGVSMSDTTKNLYKNAVESFKEVGATAIVDSINPENPVLVVTKGTDTLIIPESKNTVNKNGSNLEVSSVAINISGTFYVSQEVVDLIK
ncbi:MAG: alkaline phosphatase [Eubacteriales bacterium]